PPRASTRRSYPLFILFPWPGLARYKFPPSRALHLTSSSIHSLQQSPSSLAKPKAKKPRSRILRAKEATELMAMAPPASAVSFSPRPSTGTTFRPRAASASGSVGAGRVRAAGAPEGGKWWAPLLGWSGRADYMEAAAPAPAMVVAEEKTFVGLTEEKARQLRARMSEMESFHDAMYHSAIASRLARST
uniref:Uncharacterized protein n=1 Tax=Aegilops tauschii subsp. strangulata TaxID=200361 RepID=A0A452Y4M4_AEGTS